MSEGEDILAATAAEAGLRLPPAAAPVSPGPEAVEASPAPTVDMSVMVEKLLPTVESTLAAVGGAHWRLTPEERKAWCMLLCLAYPDLDPGRFAKPLFWVVTLAIFGPRLALTVKILMKGMKDAKPASQPSPQPVQERKPDGVGEAGKRQDDSGAQGMQL
jgi:hypothetical protein